MLLCAAVGVLAVGVALYALFRNADLLVYAVFGKPDFVRGIYRQFPKGNRLIDFAVYSAPDGLWLASCLLCLRALWLENSKTCGVYMRAACVAAVGFELLQLCGALPGTFDVLDLLAMVLAAFGEGVFYTNFLRRRIRYAYQS
jgi:hypothetical protein